MSKAVTLPNKRTIAADHPSWDPILLSAQAAEYLGMSLDQLQRMARRREIPCVRASDRKGSPVKFRLSDLNRWIQQHTQRPLRAHT